MKKALLTLTVLLMAGAVMAQESEIRIPSGYQGFLEQGSIYRVMDEGNTTVGVSTTHGFYFGEHTFVGIGLAIEGGNGFFAIPVYTALKYNFSYRTNVSPTMQVRLGSYVGDNAGTYADLAVGVRFASKRDFAVNLMITGTYYEKQTEELYTYNRGNGGYTTTTQNFYPSGIGLRVGIEW